MKDWDELKTAGDKLLAKGGRNMFGFNKDIKKDLACNHSYFVDNEIGELQSKNISLKRRIEQLEGHLEVSNGIDTKFYLAPDYKYSKVTENEMNIKMIMDYLKLEVESVSAHKKLRKKK